MNKAHSYPYGHVQYKGASIQDDYNRLYVFHKHILTEASVRLPRRAYDLYTDARIEFPLPEEKLTLRRPKEGGDDIESANVQVYSCVPAPGRTATAQIMFYDPPHFM